MSAPKNREELASYFQVHVAWEVTLIQQILKHMTPDTSASWVLAMLLAAIIEADDRGMSAEQFDAVVPILRKLVSKEAA